MSQIHALLTGKRIEYVATNGNILLVRCTDGFELQVAWVDDNGAPIKGKPVAQFVGTNIRARPVEHRREVGI